MKRWNGKRIEGTPGVVAVGTMRVALAAMLALVDAPLRAQVESRANSSDGGPRFRSGVEAVTLTAAVRDRRGQPIRNLTQADFEVFDSGSQIQIRDFFAGDSPVSVAVLLDISGSMAVGGNIDRAANALEAISRTLRPGFDEAAVFAFDSGLHRLVEFTTDVERLRRTRLKGQPWGLTSLYDSIAGAAQALSERPQIHRAVLVVTDGVDMGSRLTPQQVSTIASSIDVPVYVVVVATQVDLEDRAHAPGAEVVGGGASRVTLEHLARWTGGDTRNSSTPVQTAALVQDVFSEIRHRYLITFDPNQRPGWHPVEIRTKNRNHVVRARGWYRSGGSP